MSSKLSSQEISTEELIRRIKLHSIERSYATKSGHIGGQMSIAELLGVLYNEFFNFDSKNPNSPTRDRLILSKGHAGLLLYSILAELNFFPLQHLIDYKQNHIQMNGQVNKKVPGVEFSTGSLGHGISVALGMALNDKNQGLNNQTYVIVGDGEMDEGSNYEGLKLIPDLQLNNIAIILDDNNMKIGDNYQTETNFDQVLAGFGFEIISIDGHNLDEIRKAFQLQTSRPKFIHLHTIKGNGISFFNNQPCSHAGKLDDEKFRVAWRELKGTTEDLIDQSLNSILTSSASGGGYRS